MSSYDAHKKFLLLLLATRTDPVTIRELAHESSLSDTVVRNALVLLRTDGKAFAHRPNGQRDRVWQSKPFEATINYWRHLDRDQRDLLLVIKAFHNATPVSYDTLSAATGQSKATLMKHLNALEAAGEVLIDRGDPDRSQSANTYTITGDAS